MAITDFPSDLLAKMFLVSDKAIKNYYKGTWLDPNTEVFWLNQSLTGVYTVQKEMEEDVQDVKFD
jgi:hypothetical protein